jgi:hypothetical protein
VFSFLEENESVLIEIFELEDGILRLVDVVPNTFDRADVSGGEVFFDVIILKEPIEVGNEWMRVDMPGNRETARIISVDTEITVPHGTFTAVVVELINDNGSVAFEYYVPGLGLVYAERDMGISRQSRMLAEVVDGPFVEYLPIFKGWNTEEEEDLDGEIFPVFIADVDYAVVRFYTNADAAEVYTEAFREYFTNNMGIADLAPEFRINSISVDMHNLRLNVDLSAELAAFLEGLGGNIIQLAADTLGYAYSVTAVNFFADGEEFVMDVILTRFGQFDQW